MCTIDSADASKYDADRWEAYAKSFAYAQKVSTSFNASTTMRTQVREAMNNLIYNWKRLIAAEVTTVTFTFTVNGETVTSAPCDMTIMDWATGTVSYQGETYEAIVDGAFEESTFRSAPYFTLRIDGIVEDAQ